MQLRLLVAVVVLVIIAYGWACARIEAAQPQTVNTVCGALRDFLQAAGRLKERRVGGEDIGPRCTFLLMFCGWLLCESGGASKHLQTPVSPNPYCTQHL